jgi:parallel beta-helix repeat protein
LRAEFFEGLKLQILYTLQIVLISSLVFACGGGGGNNTANTTLKGLNVTIAGQGRLNSIPSGLSCEGSCFAEYPSGSLVTLKAVPIDGAKFLGWGGSCIGVSIGDGCVVMLDQLKSANAIFTSKAPSTSCLPVPVSSRLLNVKDFGAKGDGLTDDTVSIQKTIDAIGSGGGTVLVPDGIYMIDAVTSIRPKAKVTIRLTPQAVLRATPNSVERYAVVFINGVSDVNITGGTIEGDRNFHKGATGEWGMGIQLNGAKSIVIENMTIRDAWGDGVYIGGSASVGSSESVTICGLVSEQNRRQGLSAVYVNNLLVRDSVFKNTSGTRPELGLDIEPNPGQTVKNVIIQNSLFSGNSGGGIAIALDPANKLTAFIENVIFKDNIVISNGQTNAPRLLAGVSIAGTKAATILGNKISDNIGVGVIDVGSTGTLIENNTVTGTSFQTVQNAGNGTGVNIISGVAAVLRRNTIMINQGAGILIPDGSGNVLLEANIVFSNGS